MKFTACVKIKKPQDTNVQRDHEVNRAKAMILEALQVLTKADHQENDKVVAEAEDFLKEGESACN